MKRVLITGATGFVGRNCLKSLLSTDSEVYAVTSKAQPRVASRINWCKADLLESDQIRDLMLSVKPTHLVHCAWYAVPGKFYTAPENLIWVQATLKLVEEFSSCGGDRALVLGTCAEYDWSYGYCSEFLTPCSPNTLYGACKHASQIMLEAYAEQVGLSYAWARLFFLYGAHEHPGRFVPYVICSLLEGRPAECRGGNLVRDYLHVEDAADALIALLESDAQGPVNIGSGRPLALIELAKRIGQKIGREDLIQDVSHALASPGEAPLVVANVERLSGEVGWQPKYDLDSGLERCIEWWRSRHKDQEVSHTWRK